MAFFPESQVLWQGCTQTDKDTLANNQQQWIRGKVFGKSSFENNWKIFPLWSFMEWNSACITASTVGEGYYRVNINGHYVLQAENIAQKVFKNPRASFEVETKVSTFLQI